MISTSNIELPTFNIEGVKGRRFDGVKRWGELLVACSVSGETGERPNSLQSNRLG